MQSTFRIKRLGLYLGAVLALLYVVVMLASMFLVGLMTTGSWQAVFLDIGWSTIARFEIGFLGVLILSYALASVYVTVYNFVQHHIMGRSKTFDRASQPQEISTRSWQVRLLTVCLVLPALTLLVLHVFASTGALGAAPSSVGATIQNSGTQMQPVNMSPVINTTHREAEPSFTADGRTMYFNCLSGDICVSHLVGAWEQGNWTEPKRLGGLISTGYEEVEPVINATGDKLYFTSIRPRSRLAHILFLPPFISVFRVANTIATSRFGRSLFGGLGLPDIYVSNLVDSAWSNPRSINEIADEPHLNTPFADHCLFFSADGDEVFWTSTRPGGMGDNDIWTSRKVYGIWSEPKNLGTNINSPGSEHTSIPTTDGQSLYVTASRSEGFGGEDIYVATRDSGNTWNPLVNLGPLINGPGDDRCPAWTPDLKYFLFDSVREGGSGARDIWWVHFEHVQGYSLTE